MICQRMNVDMATKHGEKDFGEFLTDIVEHGGIAMGIGIGSQLKIFDVMVNLGPKTSTEIATAGNWKPRLVITEYMGLCIQLWCPDVLWCPKGFWKKLTE